MASRREALATLAAGLAVLAGWRYLRSDAQEAVAAVLYKRLHYLRLDPGGVRAYARDVAASRLLSPARLRLLAAFAPLYRRLALDGDDPLQETLRHGEERVVSGFLLSSDFFANGADATRLVRYLGYYDPFMACSNPFARPPGPAPAAAGCGGLPGRPRCVQ